MNHIRRSQSRISCSTFNACHPERSLATSEATGQTESTDPYNPDAADGMAGNFRILVRFLDEGNAEVRYKPSPEAAAEYSPRRWPWESGTIYTRPEGPKETLSGQYRQ